MKKIITIILFITIVFSFAGCGKKHIETVIRNVESEIYSQEEINSAIDTIQKELKEDWKGCTLTEVYYAGDEISEKEASNYNAEDVDVMVLLSSMYVARHGGDGSLNTDFTYKDWMWILVKSDNGEWVHVDHGY